MKLIFSLKNLLPDGKILCLNNNHFFFWVYVNDYSEKEQLSSFGYDQPFYVHPCTVTQRNCQDQGSWNWKYPLSSIYQPLLCYGMGRATVNRTARGNTHSEHESHWWDDFSSYIKDFNTCSTRHTETYGGEEGRFIWELVIAILFSIISYYKLLFNGYVNKIATPRIHVTYTWKKTHSENKKLIRMVCIHASKPFSRVQYVSFLGFLIFFDFSTCVYQSLLYWNIAMQPIVLLKCLFYL